jgi:hypothetical protein
MNSFGALVIVAGFLWGPRAEAAADYCHSNSGAVAVDLSQPVTDGFLKKMKSIGVLTIIRYYDYEPPTLPHKTLHQREHDLILSHGFSIAVVFQHHNDQFASFTPERGKRDAERSLELAAENSQPKGEVVYFGVDGSWGTEAELDKFRSYFRAARDVLASNDYKIGVYGSGRVCQDLLNKNLAQFCWLANAKSWPDYKSFYATKNWRLAQSVPEDCGGINVDFNVSNGKDSYFGQFGQQSN